MTEGTTDYGVASYRDIEFEIQTSTRAQSRRVNTVMYPFIDQHYNEDLGANPDAFSISGVFTGEDARDKYTLAQVAWLQAGVGVLFEPTGNQNHKVKMLSVDWVFDAFAINYIPFTLTLVSHASDPYPKENGNTNGNIDVVVNNNLLIASDYYVESLTGGHDFASVLAGFDAAKEFVYNVARRSVTNNYFNVANNINAASPTFSAPLTTVQTVGNIFENAASNSAPIEFFREASEVRVVGTPIEEVQASLFALNAISYYFEAASGGVAYSEVERLITRVVDLKNTIDNYTVKDSLNNIIIALGGMGNSISFKQKRGPEHALVASYELYGNIDRAQELLKNSDGVSGARLETIRYKT